MASLKLASSPLERFLLLDADIGSLSSDRNWQQEDGCVRLNKRLNLWEYFLYLHLIKKRRSARFCIFWCPYRHNNKTMTTHSVGFLVRLLETEIKRTIAAICWKRRPPLLLYTRSSDHTLGRKQGRECGWLPPSSFPDRNRLAFGERQNASQLRSGNDEGGKYEPVQSLVATIACHQKLVGNNVSEQI